jgi:hypothetical protein
MSQLLHKSSIELTSEQERIEAEKLSNAYFMTQKIAGKLPGLVNTVRNVILEKFNEEKGSMTYSIKNNNNTIRCVKNVVGTPGRHATSNIVNITKSEALRINQTLKGELKDQFSKTSELLVNIEENDENELLLEQLSQDIQKWELSPHMRIVFFKEVRKITKAFKSLNLKGKRLIKAKSRLRYETVVIDLICKGKIVGIDKKSTEYIFDQLAREIQALEILCGTELPLVLADIQQLYDFDKKLIEAQNNLVLSCQKHLNYIVHSHARKLGLSDCEREDVMSNMIKIVIEHALYNFDGSFRLKTYLNSYFTQCKKESNTQRQMMPLRTKVTKYARWYYEAKKVFEGDGRYYTSQDIADYVNSKTSKANATCETVDELFHLGTVSLDVSISDDHPNSSMKEFITNGANITDISAYSPMFDIEENTIHTSLEKDICDYISQNYNKEYSHLFALRHGLLGNTIHTYEELREVTGYSKDILRRRFVDISDNLKKKYAEVL